MYKLYRTVKWNENTSKVKKKAICSDKTQHAHFRDDPLFQAAALKQHLIGEKWDVELRYLSSSGWAVLCFVSCASMNVKWNDLIYEDVVSIILVFLQAYVNLNFVREVINQFLLCMSENWIELSDYLAPGIAGSWPPITWLYLQPTTWLNTPSANHLTEYTLSQSPDWIHLQPITWLEYTLSQSERHNWAKDLFIPSVATMPDPVRHVLFFYPNPKPYV